MASQVQSCLLACWAVGEGNMVVGDFVPEMNLVFRKQDAGSDGVDGCVAPSFVEETAFVVESLEVVEVLLRPEPRQTSNFEVRPLEMSAMI